ncbi:MULTISPECIES: glycosyltransferase [Cyanophyceae]|uniref:glycosyltransferase n=1 Tax=Cyanophyceae TaxID=3028117 RepID=UPI0016854FCC|nr:MULTISPECIES: glycosyltransferase [Cyanophyceae]MBD1914965.1 glycosyltransferase [Phormidium sp. FACHB-77]MBD2032752.1 glycosyltransferase [Phormidium sp. FACHB-322]MBD2049897.1 glycosyltransferase [Leptolyngbya sp. FACHB-60]
MNTSSTDCRYPFIQDKLDRQQPLRILYINDLGFQYGAGIAALRQIQSFLLMGHAVKAISCTQGETEKTIPLETQNSSGRWLGLTELPHLDGYLGLRANYIIEQLILEVSRWSPDVIVVGNLHSAMWPLDLLKTLQSLKCLVIAYMHDCYLISGRCAYTGNCTLYQTGCNDTCPTWQEYPVLEPKKIFDQWQLRREIFCGANAIPLAANSRWTADMANKAFHGEAQVDCLYYGIDEQLFQPINRTLARKILGIPQNKFVILGGSVNVTDYRKGGHIFKEVVQRLKGRAHFVVFGMASTQVPGVCGTGLIRDYRRMPLIYSAVDLFVGTSLEEAFGQTFCEASACAVPIVAFKRDGIPEIARHELNARLANEATAEALIDEIEFFMGTSNACQIYGEAGRKLVEKEFSLKCQGERWMNYFRKLSTQPVGNCKETSSRLAAESPSHLE